MSNQEQEEEEKEAKPSPAKEEEEKEEPPTPSLQEEEEEAMMPATTTDTEAATKNAAAAIANLTSFEDDGTFALPPGETLIVTPVKPPNATAAADDAAPSSTLDATTTTTPPPATPSTPSTPNNNNNNNNVGKQILMNRFSNWRQKANENATQLYQRAREAQEQAARENKGPLAALRQVAGVDGSSIVGIGGGGAGANSNSYSDEEEEESSSNSRSHSVSASGSGSTEDDEQEEGVVVEEEEENNNDEAPMSMRSLPNLPSRQQVRSRVQNLAGGVITNFDSVATGFRGRYANSSEWNDLGPRTPLPKTAPQQQNPKESQTALILKSRAAEHLQEILNSLEPFQYVMLLGAGRLQVNLKNPYVKHQGTYVDFLVTGGAADRSGVVAVGDSIVKVGPKDVRKHTIADVPSIIAKAKRPVVLVLTTGTTMEVERITYLDLAVAMMHRIRDQDEKQKQAMIASAQKNKKQSSQQGGGEQVVTEDHDVGEEKEKAAKFEEVGTPKEAAEPNPDTQFDNITIPSLRSVEEYANPPQPPMEARQAYKNLVGKRCNDNFSVTQLSQVAASDDNFRAALRNAFLCCAVDGRRFPFFGRHLSLEQDMEHGNQSAATGAQPQQPDKNNPNALLMLFLELMNFSDLHGVTPSSRRRDIAQRIAFKFFLPTKIKVGTGHRFEVPIFDFHHIVPDSVLRQLESTLNNAQAEIPQDLFLEFQHAVADALCGTTFLLFLVSNQCARMRAYLRNVAPFVNISLKPVFERLIAPSSSSSGTLTVHPGAKNYFLYILIYMMQLEKDPTETLSTDNSTLLGRNGRRMVGAAGGLCCCIFIGRVVLPALRDFQKQQEKVLDEESKEESSEKPNADCQAIINGFSQLWEIFLAPGVGALEHSWKSRETKEYLDMVRTRLRSIRNEVLGSINSNAEDFESQRNVSFAKKFASEQDLRKELQELADNLLYDYATNSHSKFREHVFHDWLCNEMTKAKKEQSKVESSDERVHVRSQLPELPSGCIKRLLRKVDLPVGVSPHKPIHSMAKSPVFEENKESETDYPNADCGIVFGSSVGSDLAVQMMSPAMEHSDIRRYSCQDVTLNKGLPESFEEDIIPPTLESYAVLPPTRNTVFSEVTGNVCLSSDGWEVSLINFMIPKADDCTEEEQDKSLYGVSLVFQRSSTARFHPRRISQTQLHHEDDNGTTTDTDEKKTEGTTEQAAVEASIDEAGQYPSPLSFGKPSDDHWSTFTRSIKVSEPTPTFNGHLREKAWIDRVLQDDTRDQDVPATVGVALVSRKNVVIAMRQTLWMLLRDFSRMPDDEAPSYTSNTEIITCGGLVDLLGNFSYQNVERNSLRCILEPYIRAASSPWIERPLSAQKDEFIRLAGQQLITCLPPIPLALLLVATLLEQKIVLSSSRRSILFSATEALKGMLAPLKWCHLLVPLVPSALAKDLIQYPAPFILGMPSEDPGVMEILNELPMDVTLVDLDVGRVILAPEFSFDNSNAPPGQDARDTMRDLRSQVLYLAQSLGSLFGAKVFRASWTCDSPTLAFNTLASSAEKESDYDILRSVCRGFVEELLAGISSSCFWIEEESEMKANTESTVLFDEDRFFHIKRWREQHGFEHLLQPPEHSTNRNLALSMDGFHLVLETFVRCQSLNSYLSSRPRDKMAFSF